MAKSKQKAKTFIFIGILALAVVGIVDVWHSKPIQTAKDKVEKIAKVVKEKVK